MSKQSTVFFDNETYDGQFVRTLTASYAGMADLGEAFATARQIDSAEPDRWYTGWHDRAEDVADRAGHAVAVPERRSALLRASEYYRQAYFFLRHDINDQRLLDAHGRHVATFHAAMPLLRAQVEQITIPYAGGVDLKAYFFAPDASGQRRPTLLFRAATTPPRRRAMPMWSGRSRTSTTPSALRAPARAQRCTFTTSTFTPTSLRSAPRSSTCSSSAPTCGPTASH